MSFSICELAEIPDPVMQPILHELCANFQLHTPCDTNAESGCRNGKDCKRHFPKDMSRCTVILNNAFPKYRRRGLHYCNVNGRMVGDDWVVPFNPFLTMKYRCHINCEVAASIKSFKYVYKYGKTQTSLQCMLFQWHHLQCWNLLTARPLLSMK